MTPFDVVGVLVLILATLIASLELALSYALRELDDDDPCRERPSSLPPWRAGAEQETPAAHPAAMERAR